MSWRTASRGGDRDVNNGSRNGNRSSRYQGNNRNADNDRNWRSRNPDNNESGNRNGREVVPREENFFNPRSPLKMFMISLQIEDEVSIARSLRCEDLHHSEIVSFRGTDLSKSFSNVAGLEDELRHQLSQLKGKRCRSMVTIHHGVMHYVRPEGSYQIGSLLKHARYERLFHDSVNFDVINMLPCVKELMRFDIQITTPDRDCELTYQVFVKDGSFIHDVREVDEYLSEFVVPVSVEPGFLMKKSRNVCRFDIINPMNNFTTRLKLGYIDDDDQFLSLLKKHGTVLRDFFREIEIKPQAEDLELNVLDLVVPVGYEIVYYRRSFRKEYNFQDNHLQISTEKVYHNTQTSPPDRRIEKDITDVFIWSPSLGELFENPDWSEDAALATIESELKFQDDVMCLLK